MYIFRAESCHLDELAVLFDQYRQFYEQSPDLEGCRDFIGERIKNDESVVFAARLDDDGIVGFTQLYRSYCCRAAGRLQLETAITNRPGQSLYEDLGWERDEEFYTYHLELESS
jgi:hypothetical protein